jgi:hypothetical protein
MLAAKGSVFVNGLDVNATTGRPSRCADTTAGRMSMDNNSGIILNLRVTLQRTGHLIAKHIAHETATGYKTGAWANR